MEVTPPHKILYVITKANWGGAQKYVFDLALEAKKRGYDAAVAYGEEGLLAKKLAEAGVRTMRVAALRRDVLGLGEFKAAAELWRLFREERPDIVHLNSSKAGLIGTLAARMARVPRIVFTAHGWAFNEPRRKFEKNLFGILHHLTILGTHRTICNSEATYRDVACMPGARGRLVVIYNGVEPVELHGRAAARAKLAPGLKATFWLGTLAELHRVKGLDVALRAFSKIAERFPDMALVLMGSGEERAHLTALAHWLGIEKRVFFCGHVENAAGYLPAFDLFLLPSRSESFGYVVAEAGLARVPVIASSVGGVPELIEHKVTGLLVPPDDADALAQAIADLREDPALAAGLAGKFFERVHRDFSKQKSLDETFALYGL